MLKSLLASTVTVIALTAAAAGQETEAPTPPPVESMSCEEMQAEMMLAGQRISAQMDPEFAREAETMQREQQDAYARARGQMAAGVGAAVACSIPGVGMACMAAQQAQAAESQRQVDANMARMQAQADRVNQSMAGLDQQRMLQLTQRFQDQNCQTPQ